jgi:hypothetical protein
MVDSGGIDAVIRYMLSASGHPHGEVQVPDLVEMTSPELGRASVDSHVTWPMEEDVT